MKPTVDDKNKTNFVVTFAATWSIEFACVSQLQFQVVLYQPRRVI